MKYVLNFLTLLAITGLSLNSALASTQLKNTLYPFTSDGCSVVPDGTLTNRTKWRKCCVQHDLKYWIGGTAEERKIADAALGACIGKIQNEVVGDIYYWGVRLAGGPNQLATYRWGYGWKYNRGYKALATSELEKAAQLVPLNISKIEITKSSLNLQAFPSPSGNYCIDELNNYLESLDKDLKVTKILSFDPTNDTIIIRTSLDQTMFAKFKAQNLSLCTDDHYSDHSTQYLQLVHLL